MSDEYQTTPINVLPETWEIITLEEGVDKMTGGGTPTRDNKRYWNGKIPWATVKDLQSSFISKTEEYITEEGLKKSSANLIPANTLILATRMAVGKPVLFDKDVAINQDLKAIIPKDYIDTTFLFYWFLSKQNYLEFLGSGSTVKGIRLEVLKGWKIAFHQKKKKKKIASILSTVDEKIETIEGQIKETQNLKKGLMQRLLTKGIGHTQFQSSPLGEIPESWEVKKLGDIFKLKSGESLPKSKVIDGNYPVYGGNGIIYYHSEYNIDKPTIIIGRVGAKCGCINFSKEKSWITDNALIINKKIKTYNDTYMFYFLDFLYLNSYANKNAQPVISGQKIYPIKIGFPPLNEQQKIASILSTVDEKLENLQSKKSQYEQLKKGLMQKLLTGKIRVQVN